MAEAVIVDAVRTPIGRAMKGSLKAMRADELAATPIRALLERNPDVAPGSIVDVHMGAVFGEGEQGYCIGRIASLLAGLPVEVPACTVNRFCASSLQSIRMAYHAIAADEGDTYLAAGVEAISRVGGGSPVPPNPRVDGSPGSIADVYIPMGMTAENVAEREGVSREEQDRWAAISQQRAVAAQESGQYDAEIVPVLVPQHIEPGEDGAELTVAEATVTKDDGPRAGTTAEGLAKLKPVFKEDGTVTAGNACPLNDGAAAVLVMSAERAAELGLRPKARIIASAVVALEPEYMGVGPIPAVRAVLERAGMKIEDVDVIELNEAFAAQVVPCKREWGIDEEKLNPFGGAIALGHPFGMTGARIMTTLLNDLATLDGTIGLETMCVGSGMGQAMLVERLN
jgi:acetyl-CoA C-acetyltransferase